MILNDTPPHLAVVSVPTTRAEGMTMCALIAAISIIALVLLTVACQGDAGPPGPQGPAGAPGPAGPPGPAGDIASGPPKWEPTEYTKYFVKAAISKYDSDGLDATVAYYNTEESIDGQWYMFILDQHNMMLAHAANPDLVGRPASEAVGPNNYPAGEAVVGLPTRMAPGSVTPLRTRPRVPSKPSIPGWSNMTA